MNNYDGFKEIISDHLDMLSEFEMTKKIDRDKISELFYRIKNFESIYEKDRLYLQEIIKFWREYFKEEISTDLSNTQSYIFNNNSFIDRVNYELR